MDQIATDEFVRRVGARGVSYDGRRHLNVGTRSLVRFWSAPTASRALAKFAAHVLAGFDPWSDFYLWPAGGVWHSDPPVARVPAGYDGAIAFSAGQRRQLVSAVYAAARSANSVEEDVYLVPDHGRQMAFWSHHDLVHVSFADLARVAQFEVHMATAGYEKEPDDYWTGGKSRAAAE
jgi:hypothetical protein